MIYVENAAEAHFCGRRRPRRDRFSGRAQRRGKAYFLSQGEPVNCWQWIDEILALVDLPPVRKSTSLAAAWRVGLACEAIWTIARPAKRAANDAVPGEPAGHVALVRHFGRPPRFGLRAAGVDGRRDAAFGGVVALKFAKPQAAA